MANYHAVYIDSPYSWTYNTDSYDSKLGFYSNAWLTNETEETSETPVISCSYFYELGKQDEVGFTPRRISMNESSGILTVEGKQENVSSLVSKSFRLNSPSPRFLNLRESMRKRRPARFIVNNIITDDDAELNNIKDYLGLNEEEAEAISRAEEFGAESWYDVPESNKMHQLNLDGAELLVLREAITNAYHPRKYEPFDEEETMMLKRMKDKIHKKLGFNQWLRHLSDKEVEDLGAEEFGAEDWRKYKGNDLILEQPNDFFWGDEWVLSTWGQGSDEYGNLYEMKDGTLAPPYYRFIESYETKEEAIKANPTAKVIEAESFGAEEFGAEDYEGHTPTDQWTTYKMGVHSDGRLSDNAYHAVRIGEEGFDLPITKGADARLVANAPKLLAENRRLRERINLAEEYIRNPQSWVSYSFEVLNKNLGENEEYMMNSLRNRDEMGAEEFGAEDEDEKAERIMKLLRIVKRKATGSNARYAKTYAREAENAYYQYGMRGLTTQVAYVLSNLSGWRGEEAKSVKAELRKLIK